VTTAGRPRTAAEALAAAVSLHQQGRLAEAVAIYREVLRVAPRHAGCLHLLGLALYQQGSAAAGEPMIRESTQLEPGNAVAHNSHGAALLALGRHAEALAAFDRAVQLRPDYAEALNNGANALLELGRPHEALDRYGKARAAGLETAPLHNNVGMALHRLGRTREALDAFDRAIALDPANADARSNRGEALRLLGRREEALAEFDRAIALDRRRARVLDNRGTVLFELGRAQEALASYDAALEADPADLDARCNRANLRMRLNRFHESLADCEAVLARAPGHVRALRLRAAALLGMDRPADALADFERCAALGDDEPETSLGRGIALFELRRHEEALPCLESALARAPGLDYAKGLRLHVKMQLCDWSRFEEDCDDLVRATLAGEKCSPPFALIPIASSLEAQLASSRTFAADRHPARPPLWRGEAYAHDRLRVGYFSSDFHAHATAALVAGLLESHDRSRFEITAFSYGPPVDDAWRRRLEAGVERFVDVSPRTDEQIAALAREMEIDIAVDLKGFTTGARTGIFALRPAPVQAAWLGYAGTLGADYIDYVVADPVVIAAAHERFYSEKAVLLPDCYQANDSKRPISPHRFGRAELGLPGEGFVFCCFNGAYKITPDVFGVWMRLLAAVPGSVLWLLAGPVATQDNLRSAARDRGIDPGRLVFAPVMEPELHLARHRAADLFLDTFHCNAHTTASDALWAGLPVVTRMGETFASRVAASLLGAVGLQDLVTTSAAQYEDLALRLATQPENLAEARARLAANRASHPLFDTAGFTRNLEHAFELMHERQARGLPPGRIVVPPRTP